MDKIYKAKEIYNSAPIPPELESVVNDAIDKAHMRKIKKLSLARTIAPIVACAVICLVVGLGGVLRGFSSPQHMPRVAIAPEAGIEAYDGETVSAPEVPKVSRSIVNDASEVPAGELPFGEPLEMYYCSGVGAWSTELKLNNDGTFVAYYSDFDMGDMADEYPDGTVYECRFNGSFSEIKKIDDFTYSMKLSELNIENKGNVSRIENRMRYVESEPYGIYGGEEFLFYLPGKPVSALSEEQRFFWHGDLCFDPLPETISCYALINLAEDIGLFTGFVE